MYLSKFRIQNYKSYLDSGELVFLPGFNVIIGENDVGKSALVEALSFTFANKPHRSATTMPRSTTQVTPISRTTGCFRMSPEDVKELLEGTQQLWVRAPGNEPNDRVLQRLQGILAAGLDICFDRHPGGPTGQVDGFETTNQGKNLHFRNVRYPTGTQFEVTNDNPAAPELGNLLVYQLIARVYAFRAERLNIGESEIGTALELATDAANLPSVLNALRGADQPLFDQYLGGVRAVFPHITHIATPPVANHRTRIDIWRGPYESRYAHLATPLSESGTGISQVLAILYVAVTARTSRVIVIDEPQSFLHPGAVRRLIDVLREYGQHQYIITTHSPTALLHATPSTLLLVEREQYESRVQQLSPSEASDLRATLVAVGAQMSDVYGADQVLWVEGETEEICFPIILDRAVARRPGLQISRVAATGDLESRHPDRIYDIYVRLTQGGNRLMPPAIGFVFDREDRTEAQREDLNRRSGGLVKFLPRRMFENYLLDASALAGVLTEGDPSGQTHATEENVRDWIATNGGRFVKNSAIRERASPWTPEWIVEVDAAALLTALFSAISDTRVQFDKVKHAPAILDRLLEVHSPDIAELAAFLEESLRQ